MELPIKTEFVILNEATIRAVQEGLCRLPFNKDLDALIGDYSLRSWLDAVCSKVGLIAHSRKHKKVA